MDKYSQSKIQIIRDLLKIETAVFDDDLEIIINKIYEDGFQDGLNDSGCD